MKYTVTQSHIKRHYYNSLMNLTTTQQQPSNDASQRQSIYRLPLPFLAPDGLGGFENF